MRKLIGATLAGVMAMGLAIAMPGCTEESGVQEKVTAKAPDGSKTTVTRDVKVEKSGDNPPPVTKAP